MRRDNHAAQVGDEIGAVVSLVRAQARRSTPEPGECRSIMSSAAFIGVAVRRVRSACTMRSRFSISV